MSYQDYESSRDAAAPVELYEFSMGSEVWRYTSADSDQTYSGNTFQATVMSRSEIEETTELNRSNLDISVPINNQVAGLFIVSAPVGVVLLRLWRKHRADPEGLIIYMGRVLNCEWSDASARLTIEPVSTSIRQPGLSRVYSRTCPHALYGRPLANGLGCKLVRDDWAMSATVNSIAGLDLSLSVAHAATDGWYTGGMLLWIDGAGRAVWRMIDAHGGGVITLLAPIPGLAPGASATVWPGCDHTVTTCHNKFGNKANFGGFHQMPTSSSFTRQVF